MGIDWGYCYSCTPKEYFDLSGDYNYEVSLAEREFDALYDEPRKAFIEERTGHLRKQIREIEKEHGQ